MHHSSAVCMPTSRGRNHARKAASGVMPRRAKTKPKRACVEARRTSMGSCIVAPMPTAAPLIAPITGLRLREDAQRHLPAAVAVDPIGAAGFAQLLAPLGVVEGVARGREVGPGAEGAARAGDDHRAHGVIGVGEVEGGDELVAHARGEGVELLGPVQRHGGDAVLDGESEGLEGGGVYPQEALMGSSRGESAGNARV
jgi:hypothetical protein